MKGTAYALSLLLCLVCSKGWMVFAAGGDDQNQKECSNTFQKLMPCLNFAQAKAPNPNKECCSSVEKIKGQEPKCLCFIIQQAHSGQETIKNLKIQEGKLLQLPSSCNLKNASVSNCPMLLGLSPSSPDAAIFSNNSTASLSGPSSSTSSPQSSGSSVFRSISGLRHGATTCLVTFLLVAFPIVSTN